MKSVCNVANIRSVHCMSPLPNLFHLIQSTPCPPVSCTPVCVRVCVCMCVCFVCVHRLTLEGVVDLEGLHFDLLNELVCLLLQSWTMCACVQKCLLMSVCTQKYVFI